MRSATIVLPLAGAVDLYAVGRSSFALAEQLERMRFAAASMEAFLGTPWPKATTIALVELESDLSRGSHGWNTGDLVVVKSTSKNLTYHELAHFYFGSGAGVRTPQWLSEGAADFLMLHTLRLTGDVHSLNALYASDQISIATYCAPDGSATVQGWIETRGGITYCPYLLGRQLLAGMDRTLGQAVVSAALRELFETGRGIGLVTTEDAIYQAFLTHTPPSQHETFRFQYSCLHGRPIPMYTPAPRPPVAPEIREALATFYHATNGPGWTNSAHWLSDAPLDQWHGVGVDCDGSVIGLDLAENQLSGPIPKGLGGLANLAWLDLTDNQLTGQIPADLGSLSDLEELRLNSNQLTGPIPPELSGLVHLTRLYLSGNQLSGPIPPEFGRLADLTWLFLHQNQLSGPIPSDLGRLAHLTTLSLWGNQLSGPIPPDLGRLAHLTSLSLSSNQLSGLIPPDLGRLAHLRWLNLSQNQLSGPIPTELGRLANLGYLLLGGNQLTGSIPPELSRLAHLTRLSLSSNQLSGPIPPTLSGLANLETLWLSSNQLTGPIPPELGRLAHLTSLSLSSNQLTGPIPPELSRLAHLTRLDLRQNQLSGPIPPEFGRLANLEYLWAQWQPVDWPDPT